MPLCQTHQTCSKLNDVWTLWITKSIKSTNVKKNCFGSSHSIIYSGFLIHKRHVQIIHLKAPGTTNQYLWDQLRNGLYCKQDWRPGCIMITFQNCSTQCISHHILLQNLERTTCLECGRSFSGDSYVSTKGQCYSNQEIFPCQIEGQLCSLQEIHLYSNIVSAICTLSCQGVWCKEVTFIVGM